MTSVFDAAFDAKVRNDELSVGPKQIVVSTSTEFNAAMAELSAGNGGTILIATDAEPMEVFVRDAGSETGKIVVTSEDPNVQSHMMTARVLDSQNVTFENLYFNSEDSDRVSYLADAYVVDSKNIAFIGNTFDGPKEGPLLETPDGVENMSFFKNVDGLLIENNHISGYVHTVRVFDSNDVLIEGNEITEVQGDAIHGGGWQNVKISNNHIHDLYGSTQEVSHSDMIQLWGGFGLEATDGVLIEGNLLDSGDGAAYQSIFIRNTTEGITHQNIHVEDNLIYNAHPNGIRIVGAENTVVDGNTLLWNQDSTQLVSTSTTFQGHPQITIEDPFGLIVNNIAARISGLDGTIVGDNAIISYTDVTSPNYFSNHFVNIDGGGARTLEELQLVPDSNFVGVYGAALSTPTDTAEDLTAIIMQSVEEGTRASIILDASLTRDENGFVDEDDATFKWTFADGVEIEGISVARSFPTGDHMDVRLTVTHNDGSVVSVDRSLAFDRNDIADVDFDSGLGGTSEFFTYFKSDASDFETSNGNTVFHLDGTNGIQFAASDSAWGGLSSFSIDLDIQKDSAAGAGRILNLQKALKMYVDKDGRVIFELSTDEGDFKVASEAGALSDTNWHNLNVTYDEKDNLLTVSVDGDVSGSVEASGSTPGQASWGLQVGAHSHSASLQARIDNFKVVSDPDLESQSQQVTIIPKAPVPSTPDLTAQDADGTDTPLKVVAVKAIAAKSGANAPTDNAAPPEGVATPGGQEQAQQPDEEPAIEVVRVDNVVKTAPQQPAEEDGNTVVDTPAPAEAPPAPVAVNTDEAAPEEAEEETQERAEDEPENFFSKLMQVFLRFFGFKTDDDDAEAVDALEQTSDTGQTDSDDLDETVRAIFFVPDEDSVQAADMPLDDEDEDGGHLLLA